VLVAALAAACVAVVLIVRGGDDGLPTDPKELAAGITDADTDLDADLPAWRAGGETEVPEGVSEDAGYLDDAAQLLAEDPELAAETLPRLDPDLTREMGELTGAAADFQKLSGGGEAPELETQAPRPLPELIGYYREGQGRFGVGWQYLAAINLTETKFGRVVSESVAGAQGPMQFIPSTWKTYGLGGDIQDPHDAILGAANYLRHSGAPADYEGALLSYNPSRAYVDAVQRYAGLIASDPNAVYLLYAWEV
jgi:hypothetical protein